MAHRPRPREVPWGAGRSCRMTRPSQVLRDSLTELDLHFSRLPNPTLVMYVFPHLAGPSRVPVPGYATTFPMFERPEYALPGEVPPKLGPVAVQTERQP